LAEFHVDDGAALALKLVRQAAQTHGVEQVDVEAHAA
jgi:hypothetical protein